jgi:hypothetical protein
MFHIDGAQTRANLIVAAAVALAIASQAGLAWSLGGLAGAHRSSVVVTATLCLGLAIPTAVLIWAVWRTQSSVITGFGLGAIALAGVLMRLPFFGAGPMLEDDHFRYMLDGALLAHGLNPYTFAPAALLDGSAPDAYRTVAAAGRAAIEQINFPELRTIYPGAAQAIFAIAHLIKPWSVDGLRIVLMICEAITALLVLRLLTEMKLPRQLVALVWCNPLLAFSLTGQAHVDAALGPCVLISIMAVRRAAGVTAGTALGLAVGVKLWPVLLAPVLLRSLASNRRAAIGFVLTTGITVLAVSAALALAALAPRAGVVAYARGWHINNMPYEWISYAGYLLAGGAGFEPYLRAIIMLAAVSLGVGIAVRPITSTSDLTKRAMWVAAATFYLSPSQFPWYAVWFLPLAAVNRTWALVAASAALPAYFLFFPLAGTPWGDLFRYWLSGLHLLPVVLVAVAMGRQRQVQTA